MSWTCLRSIRGRSEEVHGIKKSVTCPAAPMEPLILGMVAILIRSSKTMRSTSRYHGVRLTFYTLCICTLTHTCCIGRLDEGNSSRVLRRLWAVQCECRHSSLLVSVVLQYSVSGSRIAFPMRGIHHLHLTRHLS